MKKVWIIIICAAVGVTLLTAAVIVAISIWNRLRFQNDTLEKCTVSTGGGMLGGQRIVELCRQKDGSVTLSVSEKETHENRLRTVTYAADEAAFAHVRELVTMYNLYGASKRPYSRIRVLDGDTTSVRFDFSSDDFRVSEEQVMSIRMSQGFREVIAYLNSLAVGEGVASIEPQRARLYLKSGYTLQFVVEDAFDSKLDAVLSEEREVAPFFDCGILLADGVELNTDGAAATEKAEAGTIIYDPQGRQIVLFYENDVFDHGVYVVARLDGYLDSACPLIAEMEGPYQLYLSE